MDKFDVIIKTSQVTIAPTDKEKLNKIFASSKPKDILSPSRSTQIDVNNMKEACDLIVEQSAQLTALRDESQQTENELELKLQIARDKCISLVDEKLALHEELEKTLEILMQTRQEMGNKELEIEELWIQIDSFQHNKGTSSRDNQILAIALDEEEQKVQLLTAQLDQMKKDWEILKEEKTQALSELGDAQERLLFHEYEYPQSPLCTPKKANATDESKRLASIILSKDKNECLDKKSNKMISQVFGEDIGKIVDNYELKLKTLQDQIRHWIKSQREVINDNIDNLKELEDVYTMLLLIIKNSHNDEFMQNMFSQKQEVVIKKQAICEKLRKLEYVSSDTDRVSIMVKQETNQDSMYGASPKKEEEDVEDLNMQIKILQSENLHLSNELKLSEKHLIDLEEVKIEETRPKQANEEKVEET